FAAVGGPNVGHQLALSGAHRRDGGRIGRRHSPYRSAEYSLAHCLDLGTGSRRIGVQARLEAPERFMVVAAAGHCGTAEWSHLVGRMVSGGVLGASLVALW